MKTLIAIFLLALSANTVAASKCVSDTKTLYKKGLCMKGEKLPINNGSFSRLDTSAVRAYQSKNNFVFRNTRLLPGVEVMR